MNFDGDDRLILNALSEMRGGLDVPDLLPGVRERINRPQRRRRPVRVALAAAIAAALLITGCAAAFGGFDWLLETLGGTGFTDVVEPVEQSVTDEGIEFSVLAACRYGDTAVAYISVRDTTGQGRVTQYTSLSVYAGGSDPNMNELRRVYFDEETGRAVFTLTLDLKPGETHDKLSLRMSSLILGIVDDVENVPLDIDFAASVAAGASVEKHRELPFTANSAVPGLETVKVGTIGTVAGRPAVQLVVYPDEENSLPNYFLELRLVDAGGNIYYGSCDAWAEGELVSEYEFDVDYVVYSYAFDIDPAELEGSRLYLSSSHCDRICGDWSIEADLAYEPAQLEYTLDIPVGEYTIEDAAVTLAPVSLSIECTAPNSEAAELFNVRKIITTDGETIAFTSSITGKASEEGEERVRIASQHYYAGTIMPEDVAAIVLSDGSVIELE